MEVISISFLGGNEEKKLHWGLYFFWRKSMFYKTIQLGSSDKSKESKDFSNYFRQRYRFLDCVVLLCAAMG